MCYKQYSIGSCNIGNIFKQIYLFEFIYFIFFCTYVYVCYVLLSGYCIVDLGRHPVWLCVRPAPINQLFNDESIAVHIIFLDVYAYN